VPVAGYCRCCGFPTDDDLPARVVAESDPLGEGGDAEDAAARIYAELGTHPSDHDPPPLSAEEADILRASKDRERAELYESHGDYRRAPGAAQPCRRTVGAGRARTGSRIRSPDV
jgi:hypothetical protein